jgi:Concanavalin A-like lectin/glucanases superfamily
MIPTFSMLCNVSSCRRPAAAVVATAVAPMTMAVRAATRPAAAGFRSVARVLLSAAAGIAMLAGLASPAAAQPFGGAILWSGTGDPATGNGYLEVADSPALNPGAAITLEAWVNLATPFGGQACRSLAGKDETQAYWFGVCGNTLQASFRGSGSAFAAGTVPAGQWTHLAVTFDGTTQSHYVDGELVGSFAVPGPPVVSAAALRIGGDVSWPYSPAGTMTEMRLWSVARTVDQIRATISLALTAPQPGLVAVWSLQADGSDALGVYNGSFGGTWSVTRPAVAPSCGDSTATALCLEGSFLIDVSWRTDYGATGVGSVVPVAPAATPPGASPAAGSGSGLFWFFDPSNWELMVKVIDGCALDSSFWVFSAATTDVFYRLEVTDVRTGIGKIYFNYLGLPAPAVTDSDAFPASCQ